MKMNSEPPNAAKPHTCPTVFVPDLPSQRDSFENNKAYKRIVSAIVDIVGSTTNDGMSIGVEGSWGAGKTTIINLLREELRNSSNPEIRLITFDAWAHEGDPLRLTFLETLKEGLVPQGWVNKTKWDDQLDIISGRKDITDTASDYGLTWLDYIIASSFFLIPVGVAVLQDALRNGVTFDNSQPVAWQLLLGLLLCLAAPLLVLGKILQVKRMKSRADASEGIFQASKQWSLALLLNRTLTAGRTVVVKTPEPTSTEFEKKFKELMGDALNNDQQRRIVLVIDNLDRVQPTQAVAIWSTLQTFLQHRHHDPPKWLKQLYTIVLYDPKRIGEQPSESDQKTNSDYLMRSIPPLQPEQQQSEDSFLDKSFQIRLEVPPPILSDWRGYLLELLSKALPQHTPSELHEVYRVLAVERQSNPPTIRELKVYVNQICALHLQWQDSFRLSHLAYYVRLKRRQEEILDGLVNGAYPEAEYSGILGKSVPDSLASLSFNVEPKIAYQILLRNPIQDALADSSGTDLKNLAERNGFWEALENVVSDDWAAGQSEKVAISILALEESRILNDSDRNEAGSVRNTLSRIALALKSWKPFDLKIAEAVSIVSEWSRLINSDQERVELHIEQLVEAVAEGLFERDPMRKSTIAVPTWLNALSILIKRNESLELPDVDYINIIISKISDRLKTSDYVQAEEISRLLEVLIELHFKEPIAGDALRELAGGGHVLSYFNYVHMSSRAHASCAWCILTLLCFAPSIEDLPKIGNAINAYSAFLELSKKENVEDVQEFSTLLVTYKDTLTSVALKRGDILKEFLSECLKHIVSGPLAESFFTPQFILENWTVFSSKISEWKKDVPVFSRMLELLANNAGIQEIQRRGFKKEEAGLYRLLVENEKAETSTFRNWCGANLEQLTTTDWELDMQGNRALVYLASILRENGTSLHPGEQYQTAVLTTVEHVLNDTDKDSFMILVDMGFLLTPLEDGDRRAVASKVYERIQLANGDVPPGFFSSFGKIISEALRIDQRSLSSILIPIIESRDESDLKWLTRVFLKKPALAKRHADSEVVSDFRKMVLEAASKASDSATPLLHELAAAIKKAADERG